MSNPTVFFRHLPLPEVNSTPPKLLVSLDNSLQLSDTSLQEFTIDELRMATAIKFPAILPYPV